VQAAIAGAALTAGARAGEHAARGETMKLTPEETARYCATGELPERVRRWTASQG
jgi:hypothetical protein